MNKEKRLRKIRNKIESRCELSLKDVGIKTFRGVNTGNVDVFLVDAEVRDYLEAQDYRLKDIIKPVITTKNLHSDYIIENPNKYLIGIYKGWSNKNGIRNEEDFKEKYRVLYDYFIKDSRVRTREMQGEHWWELCSEESNETKKSRIIYNTDLQDPKFMLDSSRLEFTNAIGVIMTDSKHLCVLLNSTAAKLILSKVYKITGDNRIGVELVEKLPITLDGSLEKYYEGMKKGKHSRSIEKRVRDMYGLSLDDLKFMEKYNR